MRFWIGAVMVTLSIAGGLSYLASSSPDGLESATLRGCRQIWHDGVQELAGRCIAQSARQGTGGSLLTAHSVGVAGAIGVVVTLALAGGVFWLISRKSTSAGEGA